MNRKALAFTDGFGVQAHARQFPKTLHGEGRFLFPRRNFVPAYPPDFKLWDPPLRACDYAEAARAAIKAMQQQVGVLQVDEDGLALRGVLVRHLVMPGLLGDARSILQWLASELSPDTYVNLMDQYHPAHKAETDSQLCEINRRVSCSEYRQAIEHASAAGLWRLDEHWPAPTVGHA